jgi:hypothetical protein
VAASPLFPLEHALLSQTSRCCSRWRTAFASCYQISG